MTSKAHGGIQTNAPVSNSTVGCSLAGKKDWGTEQPTVCAWVTFARALAGLFAVIAGIRHAVLLLRSHFERWSGDDLDLLEAFEEEADAEWRWLERR